MHHNTSSIFSFSSSRSFSESQENEWMFYGAITSTPVCAAILREKAFLDSPITVTDLAIYYFKYVIHSCTQPVLLLICFLMLQTLDTIHQALSVVTYLAVECFKQGHIPSHTQYFANLAKFSNGSLHICFLMSSTDHAFLDSLIIDTYLLSNVSTQWYISRSTQ